MRVIYAVKKDEDVPYRFCCMYETFTSPRLSILLNKFIVCGQREADEIEMLEMVHSCNRQYRIYHYQTVDELVADEIRVGKQTPTEVIEKLRKYECVEKRK